MNVLTPVTGIAAVALAIIAETPVFPDALQYGALGLCGAMILMNWLAMRDMAKRLDRDRKEIVELHTSTVSAIRRMCEGLEDRPCLAGESRVRPR
jgi:hypothetical protein